MPDYTPEQLALIEKNRDWNVGDGTDWSAYTIEDFCTMMTAFGFPVEVGSVHWSGFWSQGDGAQFSTNGFFSIEDILRKGREAVLSGNYGTPENMTGYTRAIYDAYKHIENEMGAAALSRECLTIMRGSSYRIDTSRSRISYCNSGGMSIEHSDQTDDSEALDAWVAAPSSFKAKITDIGENMLGTCRGIADALYKDLEAEHTYQTSDDQVWEGLEANDMIPKHLKPKATRTTSTTKPELSAPTTLEGWIRDMQPA